MSKTEEQPVLVVGRGGYLFTAKGRAWHRVVCRKAHGWFPSNWVVHHIDGRKLNNKAENLIAMPRHMHDALHTTYTFRTLPLRPTIENWIVKGCRKFVKKALRKKEMKKLLKAQKPKKRKWPKKKIKLDNKVEIEKFLLENLGKIRIYDTPTRPDHYAVWKFRK